MYFKRSSSSLVMYFKRSIIKPSGWLFQILSFPQIFNLSILSALNLWVVINFKLPFSQPSLVQCISNSIISNNLRVMYFSKSIFSNLGSNPYHWSISNPFSHWSGSFKIQYFSWISKSSIFSLVISKSSRFHCRDFKNPVLFTGRDFKIQYFSPGLSNPVSHHWSGFQKSSSFHWSGFQNPVFHNWSGSQIHWSGFQIQFFITGRDFKIQSFFTGRDYQIQFFFTGRDYQNPIFHWSGFQKSSVITGRDFKSSIFHWSGFQIQYFSLVGISKSSFS